MPWLPFIAVKFPLFKENGFIHENLTGQTLKKIEISFRYINNIPTYFFHLHTCCSFSIASLIESFSLF